jgi:hypothetical protein
MKSILTGTVVIFSVCMLKLYGENAIERASRLLESIGKPLYDLVGTTSTVVKLSGLDLMNDDPSMAHVVYTKPSNDTIEKVQRMAGTLGCLHGIYLVTFVHCDHVDLSVAAG